MSQEVAHGHVTIDLDDQASGEMARIEATFESLTSKLDRQKAEISLGADVDQLKRDLKQAENAIKSFDKKVSEGKVDISKKEIADQRREMASIAEAKKRRVEAAENRLKDLRLFSKLRDNVEKESKAADDRQLKRLKVERSQRQRNWQDIVKQSRVRQTLDRQRQREFKAAMSEGTAEEARRNKAISDQEKARIATARALLKQRWAEEDAIIAHNEAGKAAFAKAQADREKALSDFRKRMLDQEFRERYKAEEEAYAEDAQRTKDRMADVKRLNDFRKRMQDQRAREHAADEAEAYAIEKGYDKQRIADARALAQFQTRMQQQRLREYENDMREAYRVEEGIEKDRIKMMQSVDAFRQRMSKQRDKEIADSQRAAEVMERERREVPKLELAYMELQRRLEKLQVAKRKAGRDQEAKLTVALQEQDTLAQIESLRDQIRDRLGRDPVGIPIKFIASRNAGIEVRRILEENNSLTSIAAASGLSLGNKFKQAYQRGSAGIRNTTVKDVGATALNAAGNAAGNAARRMAGWADSLSTASVRLGPFTASIKGAAKIMTILGPTLVDVVGGLGSLVAVAGSATGGVLSLGTAFVGGAIPAALGMFAVLKPVTEQFGSAMKASEAYQQALQKGNTDLAAKKLKELNSVLGNVDKRTRENFMNAGKLRDAWTDATKPARAEAFKTIGAGLSFAGKNMEMFARNTNNMTRETGIGLRGVMRGFDTNAFDTMSDRFNAAIQPMLGGMGHLLNYMMRVGAEAGKYLKPAMESFKGWAKGLEENAKGDGFEKRIKSMMDSTKSLGRFLVSGGRLMKQFFMGGTEAGRGFLDDMTGGMDKLTAKLQKPGGMDGLKNFFEESVAGTKALGKAVAPIGQAFASWAIAIAPFARAFFEGTGAVLGVVNALLQMTALRGPITALIATLGGLYALGKLKSIAGTIGAFTGALTGLSKAQRGVAASSAAMAASQGAAAGAAGRASMASAAAAAAAGRASSIQQRPVATQRPQAPARSPIQRVVTTGIGAKEAAAVSALGAASAKAGPQVAQVAAKTGILRTAAGGMGRAALAASMIVGGPYVAGAIAAGVATYSLYKYLSRDTTPAWAKESKAAQEAAATYNRVTNGLAGTVQQNREAASSLKENTNAQKNAKKGSDEWYAAQNRAQEARNKEVQTNRTIQAQSVGARIAAQQEKQRAGEKLQGYRENVKGLREQIAAEKSAAKEAAGNGNAEAALAARTKAARLQKTLNQALNEGKNLQNQYNAAAVKQALSAANVKRQMEGLAPIIGKQAQALGQLISAGGKSAQIGNKIAQRYADPGDAARVAAGAQRAMAAGVSKSQVMKIVADTSNADAALGRLNAAKINPKNLRIIAEGGNEAISMLTNLAGRTLTDKEMRIIERGGSGVIKLIERIIGRKLSTKEQNVVTNASEVGSKLNKLSATKLKNLSQRIDREMGKDPSDRKPETKQQMINRLLDLRNDENTPPKLRQLIDRALAARQDTNPPPGLTQQVKRSFQGGSGPGVPAITQFVKRVFGGRKADGGMGSYGLRAAAAGYSSAAKAMAVAAEYGKTGPSGRPNERQQARAEVTAMHSGVRPTSGGKYTKPTLLVGEENRSEYVISTNPKYRERNVEYLRAAADMLGVSLEKENKRAERSMGGANGAMDGLRRAADGARGKGSKKKPSKPKNTAPKPYKPAESPFGTNGAGGFEPKLTLPRKDKTYNPKASKGLSGRKKANSGWANYINDLQTQRGYWEREVGIRESMVREPAEMVVPDEKKTFVDPVTGDKTDYFTYKANPKIESEYKPDLRFVMEAMQNLMQIVQELVRAIPQAIKGNRYEQSENSKSAERLDDAYDSAIKKKRNAKGDKKQHWADKADKYKEQRDARYERNKTLREDEKQLVLDRADAGFAIREQGIAYGKLKSEHDNSQTEAKDDATAQTTGAVPTPSSAGGTGSGSDGGGNTGGNAPSAEQSGMVAASLALTANSEALSSFGQNFIGGGNPLAAQFAAGSVAGAQAASGMSNPASLGSAGAVFASTGGDMASDVLSGSSGSGSMGSGSGGDVAAGGGGTTVNMVNNYAVAPSDPASFSTAAAFQIKTVL